jgi:hypothetical protein
MSGYYWPVDLWVPETTEERLNQAAEFLPQTTADERPALRVGGALVIAHWKGGELVVNVVTEEVPDELGGPGECTVRIAVNDGDLVQGRPEVGFEGSGR